MIGAGRLCDSLLWRPQVWTCLGQNFSSEQGRVSAQTFGRLQARARRRFQSFSGCVDVWCECTSKDKKPQEQGGNCAAGGGHALKVRADARGRRSRNSSMYICICIYVSKTLLLVELQCRKRWKCHRGKIRKQLSLGAGPLWTRPLWAS